MPEGNTFDASDEQSGKSAQEILRHDIDAALDDYSALLEKRETQGHSEELERKIKEKREVLIQLSIQLSSQLEFGDSSSAYMEECDDQMTKIDEALAKIASNSEETEDLVSEMKTMINAVKCLAGETQFQILSTGEGDRPDLIDEQIAIMRRVTEALRDFEGVSTNLQELERMQEHFYEHFDEVLLFYEKVRILPE